MSSRIKITLSDEVAARLDEMAAASGEPVARVAGQMLRDGLARLTAAAHGNGSTSLDEPQSTRLGVRQSVYGTEGREFESLRARRDAVVRSLRFHDLRQLTRALASADDGRGPL
jgi:hypothetical protein